MCCAGGVVVEPLQIDKAFAVDFAEVDGPDIRRVRIGHRGGVRGDVCSGDPLADGDLDETVIGDVAFDGPLDVLISPGDRHFERPSVQPPTPHTYHHESRWLLCIVNDDRPQYRDEPGTGRLGEREALRAENDARRSAGQQYASGDR